METDGGHPLEHTYLQELFDDLPIGVLVADSAAVYVHANRAACELFGKHREAIVGRHLSEFIEGARRGAVDIQWKAFLRDGTQSGLFAIQLPDGSSRTLQFQARANFVQGLHCSFLTPLDQQKESGQTTLTMCAWTKRVHVGRQWISIEEYLQCSYGLSVSHGVCPDAFEVINKEFDKNMPQ